MIPLIGRGVTNRFLDMPFEEQDDLAEQAQRSNNGERDRFLELALPLVRKVVAPIYFRGYSRSYGIPREDMEGQGAVGLVLALNRYERPKGHFYSYAYGYIRGEVLHALRAERRERAASLGEFESELPAPLHVGIGSNEDRKLCEILLEALNPHQRNVIKLRYIHPEGLSLYEIAQRLKATYLQPRANWGIIRLLSKNIGALQHAKEE